MSNEVDKRIIEMEFKNEEFEKRAAETMSTLDRMKAKMNNGYSTKGAEALNATIKSVDFSPISKGIETVQLQFNALQIAGKRVIENLVDSALNGIRNVTGKLKAVYNQIKVGGSNRAQNIEQAKFMLGGLKVAWEDIEGDISYGVQDTAYGLDAAARVASQLVASSVTLGDNMRAALRGISGVAAMTNSSYEEIGRIFTTVAGQGRLMGDQLNQLAARGLNVAADLARSMGKSEAEIREMTSKGQIDFQTFANAMDELYGEHAKEANKTFQGALSNTKAALSRLGADVAAKRFETIRQVLVKIIPQLKSLKTAMKPVEEGINSAIESVGKLIEYLVERINVPAFVESITPKITRITDTIKEFANTAKDYIKDLDNTRPGKFIQNVEKAADTITKITDATEKEIELAKRIWEVGDLGNGEERVAKITELGESYERVQAIVDSFIDSNYDWDKAIGKTTQSLEESGKAANEFVGPMVEEKKPTTIYLIVDALYNLSRIIKNVGGSAINVISVVKDAFKEVFTPNGVAGQLNTFTGILADISDKLYITRGDVEQFKPLITFVFTSIKNLAKVTLTLAKWALIAANKLAHILNSIRNSKVVTTILETIGKCLKIIAERAKLVFNYLKESGVLQKFVNILKYIGILIGEKIANAFIFLANISGDAFIAIGNGFGWVVDKVSDLIIKIEEAGGLMQVIKDFFMKGVDLGSSWISKLADKFSTLFSGNGDSEEKDSIFKKAYDKAAAFGRGLIEGLNSITFEDLKNAGGLVAKIATVVNLLQLVSSMTGVNKAVSGFFKSMKGFFDSLSNIAGSMAHRNNAAAIESLARSIALIVLSITALTILISKSPNSEAALDKAVDITGHFVLLIGIFEIVLAAINKTKAAANARKLSITLNARRLAMATIFASVATFVWTISKTTKEMTESYATDLDGTYAKAMGKSLIVMGAALAAIVGAITWIIKLTDGMKNPASTAKTLESVAKIMKAMSSAMFKISVMFALLTATFSLMEDDDAYDKALQVFIGSFGAVAALMTLAALYANSLAKDDKKRYALDGLTQFVTLIATSMTALMGSIAVLALVFAKVPMTAIVAAEIAFVAVTAAIIGIVKVMDEIKIEDVSEFKTKMKALTTIGATISLLVGAVAALALSLGAMNSMGVTVKELFYIVLTITGMIAAIVGIGGLIASIPGVNVGLAALGAALSGFGIAMAGVAINILGLALAFKVIIDTLPKVVGALVSFEEQLQGKKDIVVSAIADFIGILAEGLLSGFLKALNILIDKTETIAEAIIDTICVLLNAIGKLLKTKSGPIVDALANLIEGVVVLLKDVIVKIIEEAVKGVKWLLDAIEEAIWGKTDMYDYSEATTLDTQAEQSALYVKSDKINAKTKEAHRRWLKMNGYDENGQRTEEWTGTTVISIDQSLKYNEMGSSNFYDSYYSNSTERGAVLNKAAKEEKENTKSFSSIASNIKQQVTSAEGMQIDTSKLTEKVGDITGNLTQGFSSLTDLPTSLNEDMLNDTSIDNLSNIISNEAEETADSFEDYKQVVNEKTDVLAKAVDNMVNTISASLESLGPKAKKYGIAMIDGFTEGMTIMSSIVKLSRASTMVAKTVSSTIEKSLEIHSPSRVMHGLGEYTIIGFANGLKDMIGTVRSTSGEVGQTAIDSMRETFKALNEMTLDEIDTSPHITPVLDLSNVTDGITSLDNMFNNSQSLRVATIASGEARRSNSARLSSIYQNGSRFDDTNTVNAIGSLQNEVSTLKDAISGMQVTIDSRALVGQIATPMDKALGRRALAGRRGI